MDTKKVKQEFDAYVDWCRRAISSLVTDPTLKGISIPGAKPVRKEMISRGLVPINATNLEAISKKRQELIDIKVSHTNRVVEGILSVSDKIGLNVDFKKIVEIVGRLHDLGRFEYATWNNGYGESYNDQSGRMLYNNSKEFKELATPVNAKNHAEVGYQILFNKGKINVFGIEPKYAKVIGMAVLHHQDRHLEAEFSASVHAIDDKLLQANINKLLTDAEGFNEAETQVYAVLTQLIKDVDCIDILYQHLTGEFPVLRPTTRFNKVLRSVDKKTVLGSLTLAEFADRWGFSVEEVLEYNGMTLEEAEKSIALDLPTDQIDPALLVMPDDLKERFFNLERLDLQEINKRYDFNPIAGMWWRLLQFLSQISFTSNLEVIKENELLDKILLQFPPTYRPNVEEAFDFAKRYLIEGRGTEIYTTNPLKR